MNNEPEHTDRAGELGSHMAQYGTVAGVPDASQHLGPAEESMPVVLDISAK